MPNWKDHAGTRFGRLVAVEYVGSTETKGKALWRCVCDCGGEKIAKAENLLRGKTKSCGCDRAENRSTANRRHGHTGGASGRPSPTYQSWHGMRQRCENNSHKQYADYGGRGISVCDRWIVFDHFLADMGERPDGRTLDRINPNGNYEPGNCRWATVNEQAINKRPRMRHSHVLNLIEAAQNVVAANDNNLQPAIQNLRTALANMRAA